jgi:hypothetical protein
MMPPLPAHENPFRTSRLLALPADWTDTDLPTLRARRLAAGRFGAFLGPHGTGKTTRLLAFAAFIATDGRPALHLRLNDDGSTDPHDWRSALRAADRDTLVCIDGLENLGPLARLDLRLRLRRAGGALATLHRPRAGWPVLARHSPVAALFCRHVALLAPDFPAREARTVFTAAGENAHEAFRRLYLRRSRS